MKDALTEIEALLSHLETFRIYVLRTRNMTAKDKKTYTKFIRFTISLVKLADQKREMKSMKFQQKVKDLSQRIGSTGDVLNMSWLIAECSKLLED